MERVWSTGSNVLWQLIIHNVGTVHVFCWNINLVLLCSTLLTVIMMELIMATALDAISSGCENIDATSFEHEITDECQCSYYKWHSAVKFATDQLGKIHSCNDYLEFLELEMIFLENVPPRGVKFRATGPVHHALLNALKSGYFENSSDSLPSS